MLPLAIDQECASHTDELHFKTSVTKSESRIAIILPLVFVSMDIPECQSNVLVSMDHNPSLPPIL